MGEYEMSSYAVLDKKYITGNTQGISEEANNSYQLIEEISQRLQESYFGLLIRKMLQELDEILIETSIPNWDGYNAFPVEKETFLNVRKFLRLLPLYVTPPNISAEPDGNLTLEWYSSPDWLFSISIDSSGTLHYAAKFGMRKHYGSEPFFDSIPQIILDLILVASR
jgi:hypothetical protein